jgi:hypothetical protein
MKCYFSSLYPPNAEPTFHRNDLFQRFAFEYAANEDKIRKLYAELEQETQQLHVLSLPVSASPFS